MIRVSDWIADYLAGIGVRKVFLLSGGGMMHLLDSISRRKEIGYVCGHHEQACTMAAQGYARETGGLGVSFATSGPGGTNTVTGVAEAWIDSSPLLVITGQSKVSQTIQGSGIAGLRQFGTFEIDIIPVLKPLTKFAAFLDDPQNVRACFEEAVFHATTGRPGPVIVDIPLDVQGAPIDPEKLRPFQPPKNKVGKLSAATLQDVVRKLSEARRPLILAGHGVRTAGCTEQFGALIEQLNVPVVTTQLAKDLLTYDHPLFVGHPGVKGDRPGNLAIQNADLILSVGCSLHVTTTGYELDQFAVRAHKIQVDIDPAVLQREEIGVNQKILCDVEEFLSGLHRAADTRAPLACTSEWHVRLAGWKSKYAVMREMRPAPKSGIDYYAFIDALSDAMSEGQTLVTDAGLGYYVIGQAFRTKKNQRVIVSGGLGTMGYALPAAIGAAAGAPEKTIVCVTGDGSLQTNLHELSTLQHNNLNVKLFVLSNGGYLSIRNTQTTFFQGHLAGSSQNSGVTIPPMDRVAHAFGLNHVVCGDSDQLASTLKTALSTPGPLLCEIVGSNEQLILPTVTSVRLESGAMQSKPLHEMAPLLSDAEIASNMYES